VPPPPSRLPLPIFLFLPASTARRCRGLPERAIAGRPDRAVEGSFYGSNPASLRPKSLPRVLRWEPALRAERALLLFLLACKATPAKNVAVPARCLFFPGKPAVRPTLKNEQKPPPPIESRLDIPFRIKIKTFILEQVIN